MEEQFVDRLFFVSPYRCHLGCVRFREGGISCLDWVYGWLFCLSLQGEEEDGLGSRRQTDYLEAPHVEGLKKTVRTASISVAAMVAWCPTFRAAVDVHRGETFQ